MGMLGSMALATSSLMPKSAAKVCTCGAHCLISCKQGSDHSHAAQSAATLETGKRDMSLDGHAYTKA